MSPEQTFEHQSQILWPPRALNWRTDRHGIAESQSVHIYDLTLVQRRPGADSSWLPGSNRSRNHEVRLNFGLDLTPVDSLA